MGVIDAMFDAFGGTLEDQWKDIVTAGDFDEHTVVAPGVRKRGQNGRGDNHGADEVLTNGSMIYVPEGTVAFVFSQGESSRSSRSREGTSIAMGKRRCSMLKTARKKALAKLFSSRRRIALGFPVFRQMRSASHS